MYEVKNGNVVHGREKDYSRVSSLIGASATMGGLSTNDCLQEKWLYMIMLYNYVIQVRSIYSRLGEN